MLGYLIYDKKDVHRGTNHNFITWLIDEAKKYDIELVLYTQENLPDKTPDFIINRSRFYKLSEKFNTFHINDPMVTKIANDKWLTYEYFKDIVPMMTTVLAKDMVCPCVVKNRFGHGGHDVHLLSDYKAYSDDYIAQDIATKGKDLRVYILDNQIYAAVLRTNDQDFKSNYSLGGQAQLYHLNEDEKHCVHKILKKLPMIYGGIDFLFHNDELVLNEIEDPVGAMMLYNLTDKNIVEDLFKIIIKKAAI